MDAPELSVPEFLYAMPHRILFIRLLRNTGISKMCLEVQDHHGMVLKLFTEQLHCWVLKIQNTFDCDSPLR